MTLFSGLRFVPAKWKKPCLNLSSCTGDRQEPKWGSTRLERRSAEE